MIAASDAWEQWLASAERAEHKLPRRGRRPASPASGCPPSEPSTRNPMSRTQHPHAFRGIALAGLAYALFSMQDATVKWLVGHMEVPQVLFCRSLIIMIVAAMLRDGRSLSEVMRGGQRAALFGRAALILVAWFSYFTAARSLGLAELTTIYFAAPILVVVLSVLVLNERVGAMRWACVIAGFCGVVLAAQPSRAVGLMPAGLALFAALAWALSFILARLINRSVATADQMLISNAMFALACGLVLPWVWVAPTGLDLVLLLGLGLVGGCGQYVLYESFRYAEASQLAPIEYTGLVWAFIYGFVIWSDIPPPTSLPGQRSSCSPACR